MIKYKRLLLSFRYAMRGFKNTVKEEQNFRIHVLLAVLVLVLAFILRVSLIEFSLLVLVITLVFLMEIANSAIERITDIIKPRLDDRIKDIKDITAAGVLVSSVAAILIGILVFWPYLFSN